MMNWITFKGHFATENPEIFINILEQVLEQTKTQFHGQIYHQQIKDIPCEIVNDDSSIQTEALKENEFNIKTDDCVKKEDIPQSSFEEELL